MKEKIRTYDLEKFIKKVFEDNYPLQKTINLYPETVCRTCGKDDNSMVFSGYVSIGVSFSNLAVCQECFTTLSGNQIMLINETEGFFLRCLVALRAQFLSMSVEDVATEFLADKKLVDSNLKKEKN